MSNIERRRLSSDDLQTVENVLDDTPTSPATRRWLLKRAAAGALGVGVLGIAAGCGSDKKTGAAATGGGATTMAAGSGGGDTIATVINTAITAEALAVTYLSGVITNLASKQPVKRFVPVLKAANASEFDHYKALQSLGAKPLTTKFWAPDAAFEPKNVFPTIEKAETLFVNAYLIGITTFARAGKADYARYAGEILGVEAEHRALSRFAQGKVPNNLGFERYDVSSMADIVSGIESLGIGLGKQGSQPGKFYEFRQPESSVLTQLDGDSPE